jgi:hypothetical protein
VSIDRLPLRGINRRLGKADLLALRMLALQMLGVLLGL